MQLGLLSKPVCQSFYKELEEKSFKNVLAKTT